MNLIFYTPIYTPVNGLKATLAIRGHPYPKLNRHETLLPIGFL